MQQLFNHRSSLYIELSNLLEHLDVDDKITLNGANGLYVEYTITSIDCVNYNTYIIDTIGDELGGLNNIPTTITISVKPSDIRPYDVSIVSPHDILAYKFSYLM